jgi:hypothetical protein
MEVKKLNLNRYDGFYRGVVLDVSDPLKLGRIKVNIHGVFDDIAANDLPWVVRANAIGSGAGVDYGNFAVPEVGSYVFCFFEKGDLYQPVYFAEASDGIHGTPTEAKSDYPYKKIIKTRQGITIIINDTTREILVNHPSGSYLKITTDGSIEIQGTAIRLNP